jgi:hypothetical protein
MKVPILEWTLRNGKGDYFSESMGSIHLLIILSFIYELLSLSLLSISLRHLWWNSSWMDFCTRILIYFIYGELGIKQIDKIICHMKDGWIIFISMYVYTHTNSIFWIFSSFVGHMGCFQSLVWQIVLQ